MVVAGKGGVGRSTVAAGLALACASAGEQVLLVDAVEHGGTRAALGDRVLRNGGELLELDTTRSLDEYLKLYLRFPIPASRLGPISRIFDYVATAAPGVTEILTIGKVGYEVRDGPWDRVIVDAPATGHVVELLAAPENLGSLITLGPLADQTAWLAEILHDRARTGVWLVTIAEDLPVTETLELAERIGRETDVGLAGAVINRMPRLLSETALVAADALAVESGGLGEAAAIVARRTRTASTEADRFADAWAATGQPLRTIGLGSDPTDLARRMWSGLT